jgi:hypothetical protein
MTFGPKLTNHSSATERICWFKGRRMTHFIGEEISLNRFNKKTFAFYIYLFMLLQDLLYRVPLLATAGPTNLPIKDLIIDSRKVSTGSLFAALRGTQTDGHEFIAK